MELIKRNESFQYPPKLSITWFNFLEGDNVRDGTAWKGIGGETILKSSGEFSLKMEMTNHPLENNISTNKGVSGRWSKMLNLNHDQNDDFYMEEIRFAMGFIYGQYNEDYEINFGGDNGFIKDKGPNGEEAYSDMYAVFYRSGPIDAMTEKLKQSTKGDLSCSWWAQIPQGFSCGRGAPPDPNCERRFERYVPTDCSNIIVKVAAKKCQKYYCTKCEDCYEEFGNCNYAGDRILHPDLGNKEDCFTYVNWT